MPYDADTGNSASIVFATTAFAGQFTEIDPGESTLDKIEDSHLGTTGKKTFQPSDLEDPGVLKGIVQFNSGTALPARGTVETATLTYPLRSDQSVAATLAGTGFFSKVGRPKTVNGQLMQVEIEFTWDGKTGPTFTPATATP